MNAAILEVHVRALNMARGRGGVVSGPWAYSWSRGGRVATRSQSWWFPARVSKR